ncbi:TIGR04255 family protein [Paraburkholderia sediminicola]|uniref:TIGR04255 family protein n=1 Tax=Paraburkholderia sediminicola TaxID=458836 RepID=UPI0038B74052
MTTATLGTWRKPPLAYVVAELVISPHYSIGSAIPAIQDALRREYPRTVEAMEIHVEATAAPTPSPAWRLLSADQTRGVQIGAKSISLHATSYTDSETFMALWSHVLNALGSADLQPFVERAGIRYVDLIVPSEGRSPREYLAPPLQGMPTPPEADMQHCMWISSYQIEGVTVQTRTATPTPAGAVWPPNLNALPLQKPAVLLAAEEAIQSGQRIGFIDTDCQAEVQTIFDPADLASVYSKLHEKMSKTFDTLISDLAKEEWK